jgi:hypothetical protein
MDGLVLIIGFAEGFRVTVNLPKSLEVGGMKTPETVSVHIIEADYGRIAPSAPDCQTRKFRSRYYCGHKCT